MKRTFMKKLIKKPAEFPHVSTRKSFARARCLAPLKAYYIPDANQLNVSFVHESMPRWSEASVMVHSKTKELIYLIRGKVLVFLNGKKILLKKDDSLVIPAGTTHQFKTKREGMEAVSILVPPLDPVNPDAEIVFKRKAKV